MNRQCYRLVYNRLRYMLMAVAEHARGKQPRARVRKRRRGPRQAPPTVGIALAWAALSIVPTASAQIVADRNAPGKQQATVMKTANGVVMVYIQAPSKSGVSRNVYSQFDVWAEGAILNNSTGQVQTDLAGLVQGNPWLAAGTARVILNEVNGASPSQLNGYLEVAGRSAQVVLANANGITCRGCGFINAAGITLSTGKPMLNAASGALEGFRVQQGKIAIEGGGLDAAGASYTDIIARAVQVNAGIWAARLQVAAGAQQLRGGMGESLQSVQRLPDTATAPEVAIDVAQLGGMYAGQIRLLGTADGVGVRNAGQLYAGAGELVVSADGTVENIGAMRARAGLQLQAQALDNSGSLQVDAGGGSTLAVQVKDTLRNVGLILGDDTRLDADALRNLDGGRIYGERVSIRARQVDNLGSASAAPVIAAHERLDIAATRIENREHALLSSDGVLAIGGQLDDARHVIGQAQVLNNASASIEAGTDLELSAASIRNSNEHFALSTQTLPPQAIFEYQGQGSPLRHAPGTPGVYVYEDESDHLQTPEGSFESWSAYDYTRSVSETRVASSDPARITAGRDMRLSADSLVNDNSQIIAGGSIAARVTRLDNIEAAGQRVSSDRGVVNNYWRNHKKGRDDTGWSQVAYEPPDVIESIAVSPMLFRQSAPPQASASQQVPIFETAADGSLVRSGGIDLRLPTSSLFRAMPTGRYLIETDPAFAGSRSWLGSDYLLSGLAINPDAVQKRLGDGYYEQKLVREQVAQLSGRRFLVDNSSDEAQYQALMDNGVTFARTHQLVPGIALSAQQMAQLTSDIVWLVEKDITLADGSTTRALVPQVYVRVQEGDLLAGGALLAADNLQLDLQSLANGGSIAGRKLVQVDARNISNLGGRIQGDMVKLNASQSLDNSGGSLRAGSALELNAGEDIIAASTTRSQGNGQGSVTHIDRLASLYVSGKSGSLKINAGRDVKLDAAALASEGDIAIKAGRDIALGTVEQRSSHQIAWDADNRRSDSSTSEAGTVVLAQGAIAMEAGRDLTARATTVVSTDGAVALKAGQDLRIVAGSASQTVDEMHVHEGTSGMLSSTTFTEHRQLSQSSAQASSVAGRSVELSAGRDVQVVGSQVAGQEDVAIKAAGNIAIDAAGQRRQENHLRKEETTGVFGSGIGFSIGSQDQTLVQASVANSTSASSVLSQHGDVKFEAGQSYGQRGSDVSAAQGSVAITARKVEISEARQTAHSTVERSLEQSGLTVAVTSPVITAIQTVEQMRDAADQSNDSRIKALAVANAAMAIKSGVDAVVRGQGQTVDGRPNQVQTGEIGAQGRPETRDANLAERVGGINLAISVGNSSSRSSSVIDSDSSRASSVNAGQDVRISATGAGSDSTLQLQGSQVTAGGRAVLQADNAIELQASRDTSTQKSSSSDRSASVGVSVGTDGLLATAALAQGHGRADGSEVVNNNARVEAGEKVEMKSGGDTVIAGAVVQAPQVQAEIGGDLRMQSRQDSSSYASHQQSMGGSLAVGAGQLSGNVQASRAKIDSQYAGVTEQSGIKAGDGGFDVAVKGRAALDGAVVSSTQEAVDAGRNRFQADGGLELRDIANDAHYTASSTSVNVGSSIDPAGELARLGTGAGTGSDSGQASSVSKAGISAIAGNKAVRTGDAGQPLKRIFDLDRVQREVNAQVKVTQGFSAQAPQAVAAYFDARRAGIQKSLKPNASEDETKAAAEELKDLRNQERALNILISAVSGQTGAAVTKESLSVAASSLRELMVEDSRKFAGVTDGKTDFTLTNMSGQSAGLDGDSIKLGGTRVDLGLLCGTGNHRCVVQALSDGEPRIDKDGNTILALDHKGRVQFDVLLAGMTLEEFMKTDDGKKMAGPTGGVQGAPGTIFNIPYQPGGWMDRLVESFAGTHDTIGGSWAGLYDKEGNIKRDMPALENKIKQAWSAVALVPATPFALAEYLPPEVWNALSTLIQAAR